MPFQDQSARIADDLDSQDSGFQAERRRATMEEEASWYTKTVSRLTMLAGEDQIAFVSGAIAATGEPTATVVVYTSRLVLVATVQLHGGDPAFYEPQVTAIPRDSITAISAAGGANVFNVVRVTEWPGRLQLVVAYETRTISLPVGTPTTAVSRELATLLPGLLSDLSG
jgi:hypothetical protein